MNTKLLKLVIGILLGGVILSGCSDNNSIKTSNTAKDINKASDNKMITIAASFYPMYILTLNVAENIPNVKVIDMTKPMTGCLHDYAVTPNDMKTLEGAKYFVVNGAGMESFLNKVIQQTPNIKIIQASKGIKLIKGEGNEGDNAHVWVSISNAILQVKNIGEQLETLDPTNAISYRKNVDTYVKKLETERVKMHKALDNIKNRDIVTFHEAFPYFAKEFNLNILGVIEREPGSQPSAKELADTIDKVKKLKVKALFAEPQYSQKAADTIAKETGAKVYSLDPVVTGPMEADAYINIMDENLKTLKEALK